MIFINSLGIVCPIGDNLVEVRRRLFADESGVVMCSEFSNPALPLGVVATALPALSGFGLSQQSRNNQLALAAAKQIEAEVHSAIQKFGPDRIAVVIGTSTSGIAEFERAAEYQVTHGQLPDSYHYAQQEMGAPAIFIANYFGISGPVYTHSSACASSAKAMAAAARLLNAGSVDAVVCGGVDSLCKFTVAGFSALQAVSDERCNPLSRNRKGINIGEAAALFLLSKAPAEVALLGWGESSDGHHMSAPDPSGAGARMAIEQALHKAKLTPAQINYINLHGTATALNDQMESKAVHDIFGNATAVSSTKPLTGHTLGAAGALEAAFCVIALAVENSNGNLPPHLFDGDYDPELAVLNYCRAEQSVGRRVKYALSNSFAFGGANAVLVMGAIE